MVTAKTKGTHSNPFEGWVPLEEAAQAVGRDHSVLRYWADTNKIKCYSVGRRANLVYIEEVRMYSERVPRKPSVGKKKVDKTAKME